MAHRLPGVGPSGCGSCSGSKPYVRAVPHRLRFSCRNSIPARSNPSSRLESRYLHCCYISLFQRFVTNELVRLLLHYSSHSRSCVFW
uniref:Uncharacterized protein n=1 Tax=Arundo donax TaxID=35708 RepID=A0A0A9ELQ0_ARUDO